MAISKYSKQIKTTLFGELRKEFELERIRDDEGEAETARKLIRLGLQKAQIDRLSKNKKSNQ